MSSEDYRHVEQDSYTANGDGLPTYDDLVAQNGPNSRFGRWRGWIEKRAAERYIDITPEERARRRERGWGNDEMNHYAADSGQSSATVPIIVNEPPTPTPNTLYIQTNNLSDVHSIRTPPRTPSPPLPPLPAVSQKLPPTHLRLHQFGSRFLPHTTSPIRCLLPLTGDKLLLIGHDDGLSVLDMYPREWSDAGGITLKGPEEAQARAIWQGESVYQMTIVESEDVGEGTPQGVVLALVGPEAESPSGKDTEALRVLRMYNLASLTSLAKWAVSQKGARPLDLRRPSNWSAQAPVKKHRAQGSIARGLKSLITDTPHSHSHDHNPTSYQALLSPSPSVDSPRPSSRDRSPQRMPHRKQTDDSWDVVDELPLRWATDFVPLASQGSRLSSTSVLSYALWNSDPRNRNRGGRLLAVATKNNIFLYETPKGERAFRFVKEFYTPMVPRSITFFQQTVTEVSRSVSTDSSHSRHRRSDSTATLRESNRISNASTMTVNYGTQLSLFVIFDKKAGWIRLADSAVGEMELHEDGSGHARELSSPTSRRKSRISTDSIYSMYGNSNKWIPPSTCELPVPLPPPPSAPPGAPPQTLKVALLTKGKKTHIVPSPVPSNPTAYSPYRIVTWKNAPTNVVPRLYEGTAPDLDGISTPPYLQLISLGELGVEVQELPLTFLSEQSGGGKGKGKARASSDDVLYTEEDTGGDSGFLCEGGHWDLQQSRYGLNRTYSSYSLASDSSGTTLGTEELLEKMEMEQGIYCWCRKGLEDYRVFWLGGSLTADYEEDEQ